MQNELNLKDGSIGFMEEEPEPLTFLSIDKIEKIYLKEPQGDKPEIYDYPHYEILYELSTSKTEYVREAYTFLTLLGDFGGFNGSVVMLVSIVSSFYSA